MNIQRKALALISGGLDSMLAVRLVQEQGILVEGINFYTGFCIKGHTQAIRKSAEGRLKRHGALWVAEQLGIRLHILDISEAYRTVVLKPRYGYGSNLNPCLDCKIMMVSQAMDLLKANGFDFIITGEVLGQRPMSQRSDTLPVVARDSGANDRLLRPLCAKLLPPTLPERESWVDRNKLLGFNGRGRKPQIELAQRFGFNDYAQPAGGCCFLTDVQYAVKLADLWHYRGRRDYDLDDILLLKVGRHLRPAPNYKVIMAREEGEGRFLAGYRQQRPYLLTISHPGPAALIDGTPTPDNVVLAASLIAGYSKGKTAPTVTVEVREPGLPMRHLEVAPLAVQQIPPGWRL